MVGGYESFAQRQDNAPAHVGLGAPLELLVQNSQRRWVVRARYLAAAVIGCR